MMQESENTELPPDVCLKGVTALLTDATKGQYFVIQVRTTPRLNALRQHCGLSAVTDSFFDAERWSRNRVSNMFRIVRVCSNFSHLARRTCIGLHCIAQRDFQNVHVFMPYEW